eukprot:EG_transcript_8174
MQVQRLRLLQHLWRCAAPRFPSGRAAISTRSPLALPSIGLTNSLRGYSSAVDVQQWMQENDITCSGTDPPAPLLTFQEGRWPKWVADAVRAQGFVTPTLIQSIAWGVSLQGRDLIGIAATGSGKTLGFALPSLMTAMKHPRKLTSDGPSSVVVCPTRELAQQTYNAFRALSRRTKLRCACLFGGSAKSHQLEVLAQGVDVVVCTPGRLIDLVGAGALTLDRVAYLVLDEADRMLDMGFEPQVREIFRACPQTRQTQMWSATWPMEIRALAAEFLNDPVHITVGSTELTANKDITQHVVVCSPLEKVQKLTELLKGPLKGQKLLVFAGTKTSVDSLQLRLEREGFNAYSIHGDKTQMNRDQTIYSFRNRKDVILVATDVAARGLDVRDIDAVINYDFPQQISDFIHRIGRTARAGAKGEAYTLFTEKDSRLAADLVDVMKKAGQAPPAALEELVPAAPPPPPPRRSPVRGAYRSGPPHGRAQWKARPHYGEGPPRESWSRPPRPPYPDHRSHPSRPPPRYGERRHSPSPRPAPDYDGDARA